jgi:chaperonin GroES
MGKKIRASGLTWIDPVLNLPLLAVGDSVCQNKQLLSAHRTTKVRWRHRLPIFPIRTAHAANGAALEGAGSMKIRPLQDRIIVKRVDGEETSKGGIIIPDSAKEKPQEGKVIAVGKGKVNDDGKVQALDVKKGDKILFSKYAGTEINIEGEEHLIIREDDVLGVVE